MRQARDPLYRRHRFPAEVIGYAAWLYFRFPLSLRMVVEMLAVRGIEAGHETVRHGPRNLVGNFPIASVGALRLVAINGVWTRSPSRSAAGSIGYGALSTRTVLNVLVQNRRDRTAAQRLMRKLLQKSERAPRVMITDKLISYDAARIDMGLNIGHRQHKGLNNRAENSHLPTRRRERIMKRFKSPPQVQMFLSIHDHVANLFHLPRNRLSAIDYRADRAQAIATWAEITTAQLAP